MNQPSSVREDPQSVPQVLTSDISKFPAVRHAEVRSVGFTIARDWPYAFHAVLDEMARADHIGLGAWGAEQVYGYLYLWAKRLPMGASGDAIRTVLFTHHAARGPVHKTSVVARHAELPSMSVSEIAGLCGRTPNLIAGYVKALGAWPERTKRGTPVGISRQIADEIRAILDRAIRSNDLPAVLGLGKRQTKMLVAARIIAPAEIHRRAGIRFDVFDREVVAAVLVKLRGAAPTVEAAPVGLLPLARASKHARVDGVRGICGMLLAGQLQVRAVLRDAPGLAGILVDPEDIRVARRLRNGGGLTLEQVGRCIKVPTDIVGQIVRQGVMKGAATPCGEILVKDYALAEFNTEFVTTGALAKQIGSGVRWVRAALDEANIDPVFATKGRKVTTVWRRKDVPTNLRDRILRMHFLPL